MFFATSGAEAIAGIVPFACCVGHATDVMVFPARRMARGAIVFDTPPPATQAATVCRANTGCRGRPTLSAQERTLETSAIITCRRFAHHVSDDRRSRHDRRLHESGDACRRVARPARDAGRERPGPAPRHIDNQETR
jgi:hypothetical protein